MLLLGILSDLKNIVSYNYTPSINLMVYEILKPYYDYFSSNETINFFQNQTLVQILSVSKNDISELIDMCIQFITSKEQENIEIMDDSDELAMMSEEDFKRKVKIITSAAPKNDRMAWLRLNREMTKHVSQLDEYNKDLFELNSKRQHIIEHIDELRVKMVNECIHPEDHLTLKGNDVFCKFCDRRLRAV